MQPEFTIEQYDAAADYVRCHADHEPTIGLILGSGLGPLADQIDGATALPYAEIPHFPVSTVEGHSGRLVLGQLAGVMVCAMQGRFHVYEGYTLGQVTLPVRVMKRLGVDTLIATNAAGGINRSFQAGDLMLITDHINLLGMAGANPLLGPNLEAFGPRFVAMNRAYSVRLRQLADQVAAAQGMQLQRGVYASLAGPNFETPAEIRYLRLIGADAVGMSTVPEVIVAHHAGMEVLGISTITNLAIDTLDVDAEPSHAEVNAAGRRIVPQLTKLLLGVLAKLNKTF